MAEDFQGAARRAVRDAEFLYEKNRLGTADHLYGLAAECALKAILAKIGVLLPGNVPKRYKCHINKLWDEYGLYANGRGIPPVHDDNPFLKWRVDDRYEADGKFTDDRVSGHRNGATQVIASMVNFCEESL